MTRVLRYFLLSHSSTGTRRSLQADACFDGVAARGWPVETFILNEVRYLFGNTLAHFPFPRGGKNAVICWKEKVLLRFDSQTVTEAHLFAMTNKQNITGTFRCVCLLSIS